VGGEIPPLIFYMLEFPKSYMFHSQELDKSVSFLNEFRGVHTISDEIVRIMYDDSIFRFPLSKFLKYTATNPLNPKIFCPLDGVTDVTPWTDLLKIKVDQTDDFEWYKTETTAILAKEISKLKDKKNILFLSDGIDSCWLLYIFLKTGVDFKAIHLVNRESYDSRAANMYKHSKTFNYDLDVRIIDDYDVMNIRDKFLELGPILNLWGNYWDCYFGAVLLSEEYKEYENVVIGITNEVVMQQVSELGYFLEEDFSELNNKYGKYLQVKTGENPYIREFYKDKDIFYFFRLCGIRHTDKLSVVTNKNVIPIFCNLDLVSATAKLKGEALLKNMYKLTQYEILSEEGMWHDTVKWANPGTVDGTPWKHSKEHLDYYGVPRRGGTSLHVIDFIDWYNYYNFDTPIRNHREDKDSYKNDIKNIYFDRYLKSKNSEVFTIKNFTQEKIKQFYDKLQYN